jgi:hypothetical protein
MQWSVGLQTCPRKDGSSFVFTAVEQIQKAGWQDVTIFAEPASPVPPDQKVAFRPQRYGDWTNWIVGLFELFISNPFSDFFVMFEDDIVMCRNIRSYLEYAIPFLGNFGIISLYTPAKYHRKYLQVRNIFHDEKNQGYQVWGSQAIVLSRESARRLFASDLILLYRHHGYGDDNAHKDVALGQWAMYSRMPYFYHTPSLVEHTGLDSLIGSEPHKSLDFVGETFDAASWIGEPPVVLSEVEKTKIF